MRRVERARKAALDEQLSYLVDRTERYSRQLAANLSHAAHAAHAAPLDDDFTPREIIKYLYGLGYRIENNKLFLYTREEVNLHSVINE